MASAGAVAGVIASYNMHVADFHRANKVLSDAESHASGSQWKVKISHPCDSLAVLNSTVHRSRSGEAGQPIMASTLRYKQDGAVASPLEPTPENAMAVGILN
jgi:hypothetical protein